jgi:hypothetical protein
MAAQIFKIEKRGMDFLHRVHGLRVGSNGLPALQRAAVLNLYGIELTGPSTQLTLAASGTGRMR